MRLDRMQDVVVKVNWEALGSFGLRQRSANQMSDGAQIEL